VEFHHIYYLDTVGDKDELIRSWGQKVKGQGHSKSKYGQLWEEFSQLSLEFTDTF